MKRGHDPRSAAPSPAVQYDSLICTIYGGSNRCRQREQHDAGDTSRCRTSRRRAATVGPKPSSGLPAQQAICRWSPRPGAIPKPRRRGFDSPVASLRMRSR